jgi:hypothetical protein
MIGRLLCALNFHYLAIPWQNIAPRSGGGPPYVVSRCRRCFAERWVKNRV